MMPPSSPRPGIRTMVGPGEKGMVWVLNLQNEPLHMLPDIAQGQQQAARVFREFVGQDILLGTTPALSQQSAGDARQPAD